MKCINGCVIYGEHLEGCRGIAHNPRGGLMACPGCLPQPTERGLLCWSCVAKVNEMWDVLPDLIPHLRSVERGPIPEGPHTHAAPGSRVILPGSWQAADALWENLHVLIVATTIATREGEPTWRGDTSAWAFGSRDSIDTVMVNVWDATYWLVSRLHRIHGDALTARPLMRLVERVQVTLKAFPLQDRPHMVEYVACRSCGQLTLQWRPPLDHMWGITVRCINPDCGSIYDPEMVTADLAALRLQYETARKVVI